MKWVIEKNVFEENEDELAKLSNSCFVKYRPFDESKQFETLNGLLPKKDDKNVIFYGSINLGQRLLRQGYSWQIWLPKKVFDVNYWSSHFNKFSYNQFITIPFGCLYDHLKTKYTTVFIRPNSGYKLFTGHTINCNEHLYSSLENLKEQYNIFKEDLICVSSFDVPDEEYRFLIGNNLEETFVISSSRYKVRPEYQLFGEYVKDDKEIPEKCLEFVKDVLDYCDKIGYYPAPAWTLDIASSNGNYYLLETGSFSSAGLYDCDMSEVIKGINNVAKINLDI